MEECPHVVTWDYKEPTIDNESEIITIPGKCRLCEQEFQKTYENPKYTLIHMQTREPRNCDPDIIKENRN